MICFILNGRIFKNRVMKKYKVYFEIYGKKMATIVNANNEIEAKEKIHKKIIFHKIIRDKKKSDNIEDEDINSVLDELAKIFKG
jgi:1-deoxy-D-xylulose 5-phosphate reductoisomerase